MTTRRLTVVAVALAALVAIPPHGPTAQAAEKVTLRQKLPKGLRTRMIIAMNTTTETQMPGAAKGMSIRGKVSQTLELLCHVVDVSPKGETTLEIKHDRLKQSMNMGGLRLSFDTKHKKPDKANPMAKMFLDAVEPLLGLTLTIKLDREFQVKEVQGLEAFQEKLDQGGVGGLVGTQVGRMFSDGQFKNMVSQYITKHLPSKPIAVGDSWTSVDKVDIPVVGEMQIETKSTLVGVEKHKGKRCAKVWIASRMQRTSTKPSKGAGPVKQISVRKCDTKGAYWFDVKGGQMIEADMDNDMRLTMVVDVPGVSGRKRSGGMSMDQRFKLKMHIVVKPEPAGPSK